MDSDLVLAWILGMCIAVPTALLIVWLGHLSDGAAVLVGFVVGVVCSMFTTMWVTR